MMKKGLRFVPVGKVSRSYWKKGKVRSRRPVKVRREKFWPPQSGMRVMESIIMSPCKPNSANRKGCKAIGLLRKRGRCSAKKACRLKQQKAPLRRQVLCTANGDGNPIEAWTEVLVEHRRSADVSSKFDLIPGARDYPHPPKIVERRARKRAQKAVR